MRVDGGSRRTRAGRWRARRRGWFEGPPRALYQVARARYVDVLVAMTVLNGVIVSGFGLVVLLLYAHLSARELWLFAACSAVGYLVEGVAAGAHLSRGATPLREWLAGERDADAAARAWPAAAAIPAGLARRLDLYAIGALATAAAALVLTGLMHLPAYEALLLFPTLFLLYLSSVVLRYLGLDLSVRPLLEAIGAELPATSPRGVPRVGMHRRLLSTVPMITWGAAVLVAGLITANRRDFDTLGLASGVAVGVTAAVSIWLSLVLADAISGPIVDLRDATRRVAAGNLDVHVPVVGTDETGELSASFNAMVTLLRERERLREAFGAFVDPALTERILAEGTDLSGEEVDASILFLDVRDFTRFAEGAGAHEVVATLNGLYEAVVPVVVRHGGHANKFIGDGLLAVFGAPERHADHALRAVAAAREIAELVRAGRCGDLRVGIGVNSGRVVVGTLAGGERRDFTVIGDAVNTASRVEAATRVTGDDLLITESTLDRLGVAAADFEARPAVPLRGKATSVRLYAPRAATGS